MENIAVDNLLLAVLNNNALLGSVFDWLLKSILIAGFSFLLIGMCRNKLASSSKHLLYLNIFVCLALLPLFSLLFGSSNSASTPLPGLITIDVTPASSGTLNRVQESFFDLSTLVTVIYLIPVTLLLLKISLAAISIFKIGHEAKANSLSGFLSTESSNLSHGIATRMQNFSKLLNITREVEIRFSDTVSSPLSYGLFRPKILLPTQALHWDPSMLDDVLVHELSHIKRLDWLSMLFVYLVASVFWINPLLWIAKKQLNEEAENSCDSAVLLHGQTETVYAENLLSIAKSIRKKSTPPLLAQMMLGNSLLPNRINRILESDMATATSHKYFFVPVSILAIVISFGSATTQVLAADSQVRSAPEAKSSGEQVFSLSEDVAPLYPLRAAYAGVEGWALTEFTISAEGAVVQDSVKVVDADPADIFNSASIRAAKKFEFILEGGSPPTEIEGVQYLFRFDLGEDDSNNVVRDYDPISGGIAIYPRQAAEDETEGNVWLVFTVTAEGTAEDITVKYSSDEVFNGSAVAAAQTLRFEPRYENNQPVDVARVQYLYKYTLD
jgi:TonB family protein